MIARMLLLLAIAAAARHAFLRRHRMPVHIFVVGALLAAAAVLVIVPELSTSVARAVGVGRGVDLVGYVVDVLLLFVAVHYYTKFVDLEARLTVLARSIALRGEVPSRVEDDA